MSFYEHKCNANKKPGKALAKYRVLHSHYTPKTRHYGNLLERGGGFRADVSIEYQSSLAA
jgi:hypothetical protein